MTMEIAGQNIARPWVRFWARIFDIMVYSLLLLFIFPEFFIFPITWPFPQSAFLWQALMHQYAGWTLISLAFYILIESILLSTVGTTLGKWLLKITLQNNTGQKLGFITALKRTFLVYFRGFAFFIPFVSVITLIYAYAALNSSGVTSWDRECQITVSHQRIGFLRITGFIVLLIIFLNFKTSATTMQIDHMTLKQRAMYACGIRG